MQHCPMAIRLVQKQCQPDTHSELDAATDCEESREKDGKDVLIARIVYSRLCKENIDSPLEADVAYN